MKQTYRLLAEQHGLHWAGRDYDRNNPNAADLPNQAINHAASAIEAAAALAVAALSAIPQLGFIHEDSANAFVLDIADLYRDTITLPVAFEGVKLATKRPDIALERHVRRLAGRTMREKDVIGQMIDRIKELFDANGGGGHP